MPIEWSERFMGLNVPTITLGSNASNNEKNSRFRGTSL